MRRPLKPFVTEYKNTGRRQSPSLMEPAAPDTERSGSKPLTPWPKFDADDSYEAAMRAADALFSSGARDRSPKHTEDAVAPAAAPPESSPQPAMPDAAPPSIPGKTGGRILRVIEETPDPAFAALEAEHAPKRRGRKPGSKNKPKVAVETMATAPETTEFDAGLASAAPARAPRRRAARSTSIPAATPAPIPAIRHAAALPASPAPQPEQRAASQKRASSERWSWMRDKPRPGEEWKRRRLPRVCW